MRLASSTGASGDVEAVGAIDFNNADIEFRRTDAKLRGRRSTNTLTGSMVEIKPDRPAGETPVEWELRLEYRIDEEARVMRGKLVEVIEDQEDGGDLMCRFAWKLPR